MVTAFIRAHGRRPASVIVFQRASRSRAHPVSEEMRQAPSCCRLAFFDGRCEALRPLTRPEQSFEPGERCMHGAAFANPAGFAVCASHFRFEPVGYLPEAGMFRFGSAEPKPPPRPAFDF